MQSLGIEVLFKGTNFLRLLGGLWVAVRISLIALAISIALGVIVGMLMTAKCKPVRAFFRLYLEIVRIMPQMVLLFVVYFGTTRVFGWNLSSEAAAIIVFSFWGTAEMGDLVRGALVSIPAIQNESAQALGMNPLQVYGYVILPQTVRRLLPLSINLITRMIKTTSLVMMIGIVEVLKVAQQIIEANRRTAPNAAFGVFAVVFLLYFLICWPISRLSVYLEKKVVIAVENILLSVRNLRKTFGGHEIFRDFNLDVHKGEVVVIIGPSGCGKSTLLRCLNGLEPIQGGEILLDGEPVLRDGKSITRMRQKIGMVFQSYELFPHKTILENILLLPMKVQKRARAEAESEALSLLQRVGLADRKNDYPRQLSGGQKQRVAIVRALCMHPEILLLDEITAALDPEMVREVLEVVLSLARAGSTMVIVTHEMNFARAIADRILFIENGVIAEESSDPKAFFSNPTTDRAKVFLKSFDYE